MEGHEIEVPPAAAALAEEGPLTAEDILEFYGLVEDGGERWQLLGRKLLGAYFTLAAESLAYVREMASELGEIQELARKLPGAPGGPS